MAYQPKTGNKCHCKRGIERDNCPACEGTGLQIDFKAIRSRYIKIEYMAIDKDDNKTYFQAKSMDDAIQHVENNLDLSKEPYKVYLSTRKEG